MRTTKKYLAKESPMQLEEKKKSPIVLTSGSWLPGATIPVVSKLHDLIANCPSPILASDLKFRTLTTRDLDDFKDLEREWFPSYAGDQFYSQIKKPAILAMGCFWCNSHAEHLVAAIMIRYEPAIVSSDYSRGFLPWSKDVRKWYRAASFCSNYAGTLAHILTIGVADEVRRLGIAGALMKYVTERTFMESINLIGFSLHVAEFNIAAIKCYEKNGYKFMFDVPGYYDIDYSYYVGKYYIKPLWPKDRVPMNKRYFTGIDAETSKRHCFELIQELDIVSSVVKDIETGQPYKARRISGSDKKARKKLISKISQLLCIRDHPGLVRYSGYVASTCDDTSIILLSEYSSSSTQTLCDYLVRETRSSTSIPDAKICSWLLQLSVALRHIHSQKLRHGNLCPSAILLDPSSDTVKLDGYGLDVCRANCSEEFRSPETIACANDVNAASDVWSLGCIIYCLCTLKVPFRSEKEVLDRRNMLVGLPKDYSWELREIVKGMLQRNPEHRISLDSVVNLLKLK